MKNLKDLHRHLLLATALAAGLVVAPLAAGPLRAEESATVPTNPGFKPGTGQINTGKTEQVPSSSADIRKVPSPEEIRAALLAPDDPNPSLGAESSQPQSSPAAGAHKTISTQGGAGDPTTATQGQAAIGGPLSPGASASGGSSGGGGSAETTGNRAGADVKQNLGPIAATGQTMPAKFSPRNDVLDRAPVMALTPKFSDQERQQILAAVMADKSQAAADADTLIPASGLSTNQAFNDMHEMPASLGSIGGLKKLKYLKAKNKVLLVEPSTRIVVDQIKS